MGSVGSARLFTDELEHGARAHRATTSSPGARFRRLERPTRPHYGQFLDAWRSPAIIPVMAAIEMGRSHDGTNESP
jgi:hypothetical protein